MSMENERASVDALIEQIQDAGASDAVLTRLLIPRLAALDRSDITTDRFAPDLLIEAASAAGVASSLLETVVVPKSSGELPVLTRDSLLHSGQFERADGQAAAEVALDVEKVKYECREFAARMPITRDLIRDSDPPFEGNLEQIAFSICASRVALGIDRLFAERLNASGNYESGHIKASSNWKTAPDGAKTQIGAAKLAVLEQTNMLPDTLIVGPTAYTTLPTLLSPNGSQPSREAMRNILGVSRLEVLKTVDENGPLFDGKAALMNLGQGSDIPGRSSAFALLVVWEGDNWRMEPYDSYTTPGVRMAEVSVTADIVIANKGAGFQFEAVDGA